jgi:hypothetical protein
MSAHHIAAEMASAITQRCKSSGINKMRIFGLLLWSLVIATSPAASHAQVTSERPATVDVENVDPDYLNTAIVSSKGLLLLHVTSSDRRCGYCVRSYQPFEELARRHAGQARFARVSWDPFESSFQDPFLHRLGLNWLPVHLAYRDGQLVNRIDGNVSVGELEGLLSADDPRRTTVEQLSPRQLQDILARQHARLAANRYGETPGYKPEELIVQFSSTDTACSECIAANTQFDEYAATIPSGRPRLIRVLFNPWRSAARNAIVKKYAIKGLPTTIQFLAGTDRSRVVGSILHDDTLPLLRTTRKDPVTELVRGESSWKRF